LTAGTRARSLTRYSPVSFFVLVLPRTGHPLPLSAPSAEGTVIARVRPTHEKPDCSWPSNATCVTFNPFPTGSALGLRERHAQGKHAGQCQPKDRK